MSSTALTTNPAPLATSFGGIIAGKLNVRVGKVALTSRALEVRVMSRLFMMFGLVGVLIGRKTAGKLALTIELASIRAVARGKYGINKKILDVTVDGGVTHRVMVDDFDRFTAALRTQLVSHPAAAWHVA